MYSLEISLKFDMNDALCTWNACCRSRIQYGSIRLCMCGFLTRSKDELDLKV